MELDIENITTPLSTSKSGGFSHQHKAILMTLLIVLLVAGTSSFVWAYGYRERIAPNLMIGSVSVGGMNQESASQLLQQRVDDLVSSGIPIVVDGENVQLPLATYVTSDVIEDVYFEVENAISFAFAKNRSANPFIDTGFLLYQLVFPTEFPIAVTVNQDNVKQSVYNLFPEKETLSVDAGFVFSSIDSVWGVTAKEGSLGLEFDFETFFPLLTHDLENITDKSISLNLIDKAPLVSLEETEAQTENALEVLGVAPITFTYTNIYNQNLKWTLTKKTLSEAIVPTTNKLVTLDREKIDLFLDSIADQIEIKERDAKIEINNGRVTKFVESSNGVALDRDSAYTILLERLLETDSKETIPVKTVVKEPLVKTGDVNDLGITEMLGTGTSSYAGSPYNRKLNIQNGVDLLNGILIPPGETFSLLDALKPFTIENGYLPELVIKGEKIIPEIGGGLCQIGTTTFRAVMNSGLKIIKRQNHSLVVSYYNDQSNGNPGTDATIYDPAPDFQFMNDTENNILFQAENLTTTQELRFTFWGTSDGRKGSYVPPTVLRWIPVGEERIIETTDLEVGKKECQGAHIGADTTFDYIVEKADGTKEVVTYESHYRPLPKICLLGVPARTTDDVQSGGEEKKEDEVTTPQEDTGPPAVQTLETLDLSN